MCCRKGRCLQLFNCIRVALCKVSYRHIWPLLPPLWRHRSKMRLDALNDTGVLEKFGTWFAELPVLHVDDPNLDEQMISQSLPIARYIANRYGLAGRDDMEAARDQLYKLGLPGKLNLSERKGS